MSAMKWFALGIVLIGWAAGADVFDPRVPAIFTGNVMTNETVLFMGTGDAAPLMYAPEEILSVKSFDLQTEYREGVDWTFDRATRRLRPTANTRMPFFTEAEWYPSTGRFACNLPGKAYVYWAEDSSISLHQVCVTYRHADEWTGPVPRDESAAFAPFLTALAEAAGGMTAVYYGDSITAGGNASGILGFAPYLPSWPEQVNNGLRAATGNEKLRYVNTAVGGMNTQWGVDNVQARVIDYHPDFVLIAFGMNDTLAASDYAAKTERMVNAIHAALPNTSVLLVPPMVPNPEATTFAGRRTLYAGYEAALIALVENCHRNGFARIGCANVTTMYVSVLDRKRFRDMTGNDINHCNDFSSRIYRDTILAAMGLPKAPQSSWTPRRTGAVADWFDAGVAEGWPQAASRFGGTWRNPQDGTFAAGAVAPRLETGLLDFDATRPVETAQTNVMVSATMEFLPLIEPPLVGTDAVAAMTAVWEGRVTNYWVLAKGSAGTNVWRRLSGSKAKVNGPVAVSIEFATVDAETRVRYRADDFVSDWLPIAGADRVQGVQVRGRCPSLKAQYENLVPSKGLVIKLASQSIYPSSGGRGD